MKHSKFCFHSYLEQRARPSQRNEALRNPWHLQFPWRATRPFPLGPQGGNKVAKCGKTVPNWLVRFLISFLHCSWLDLLMSLLGWEEAHCCSGLGELAACDRKIIWTLVGSCTYSSFEAFGAIGVLLQGSHCCSWDCLAATPVCHSVSIKKSLLIFLWIPYWYRRNLL